jgi:beta-lactamase regulating signal transducer with metallopeptidase domain
MSSLWLLAASLKAGLLLATAAVAATLLRRGTAAARHQIWALGVAGALLLPVLAWVLPSSPDSAATGSGNATFLAAAVRVSARGLDDSGPAWPTWLAAVWAAGTTLVLLRSLAGHLAARRLARAAHATESPTWLSARHAAAMALVLPDGVALARSETITSPMTVGVLRARVLLPAAAEAWSPARLRAVLIHELGHVRRRDNLIQLGAQLACALYWWNPLAWLAAARLQREREHACDDLVLSSGVAPSSYAADLLAVLRDLSPDVTVHAGACMVDRAAGTTQRLARVVATSRRARRPRRLRGPRLHRDHRAASLPRDLDQQGRQREPGARRAHRRRALGARGRRSRRLRGRPEHRGVPQLPLAGRARGRPPHG